MINYETELTRHYEKVFSGAYELKKWLKGPFFELPKEFKILEFPPKGQRDTWVYATVGMSSIESVKNPIELHIHSGKEDFSLVN